MLWAVRLCYLWVETHAFIRSFSGPFSGLGLYEIYGAVHHHLFRLFPLGPFAPPNPFASAKAGKAGDTIVQETQILQNPNQALEERDTSKEA